MRKKLIVTQIVCIRFETIHKNTLFLFSTEEKSAIIEKKNPLLPVEIIIDSKKEQEKRTSSSSPPTVQLLDVCLEMNSLNILYIDLFLQNNQIYKLDSIVLDISPILSVRIYCFYCKLK